MRRIFSTLLVILILAFTAWSVFTKVPEQAPNRENSTIIFEDSRHKLMQKRELLILYNKASNDQQTLPFSQTNLNLANTITNKPKGQSPLINKDISKCLILKGVENSYVLQLEPRLVLLKNYPTINTKEEYILIDKTNNFLWFYRDGYLTKEYRVATGKDPKFTPEGEFTIANKLKFSKKEAADSQFGSRWMGLAVPIANDKRGNKIDGGPDPRAPIGHKYGIHGTNEPQSIGTHASAGCIRMDNEMAKELYDMVEIGTVVEIKK